MEIESDTFDGIKGMMLTNGEPSVPTSNPPENGGTNTSNEQPKTEEQDPGFCSNVHVGQCR